MLSPTIVINPSPPPLPPYKRTHRSYKELARKRRKIPESEYKDGPEGLKYYDLVVGAGAEPRLGDRIAIHFGKSG